MGIILVFCYKISRGTPSGGIKCMGVGKLCRYYPLSRKWYNGIYTVFQKNRTLTNITVTSSKYAGYGIFLADTLYVQSIVCRLRVKIVMR